LDGLAASGSVKIEGKAHRSELSSAVVTLAVADGG
jgi:hypothetical protein